MNQALEKLLAIRITLKSIALVVVGIFIGYLLVSAIDNGGNSAPQTVEAPTTTSTIAPTTTSTTTTTTTTTTTLPPKPAHTSLYSKVDQYYDGDLSQWSSSEIEAAGKKACRLWNYSAGVSRSSIILGVLEELGGDVSTAGDLAAAITQAVLWTICPQTAAFPDGPLPFDDWR